MLNKTLGLLVLVALLNGCAATRLDANVHTTGTWPAGRAAGSFAFERLPSQQANGKAQDAVEAATLPAIMQAGFKPAEGGPPDVLVQVAARLIQGQAIYADPFFNPLWGGAGLYGGRWRGAGWGYGAGWGWPYGAGYNFPFYAYELSMLILDARTKQPLYETRAQSEGSWPDEGTWEALSAAALRDFPYAAVSPRRVTIDLAK